MQFDSRTFGQSVSSLNWIYKSSSLLNLFRFSSCSKCQLAHNFWGFSSNQNINNHYIWPIFDGPKSCCRWICNQNKCFSQVKVLIILVRTSNFQNFIIITTIFKNQLLTKMRQQKNLSIWGFPHFPQFELSALIKNSNISPQGEKT